MASALLARQGSLNFTDLRGRARDWAEIQERMLVPLYEAVYQRLDVGPATRMLGLGCGSGLALLMAAARGAAVTGVEADRERVALARERLLPPDNASRRGTVRTVEHRPRAALLPSLPGGGGGFNMVTAFERLSSLAQPEKVLARAARLADRGSPVVLAEWGPPERCRTGQVLRTAARLAERDPVPEPGTAAAADPFRLSGPEDLEDVAERAGLRPDGSGRVACPFAYPDVRSAVRGLCSTGLFDAAAQATDESQVAKELAEALHPFRGCDGGVRMDNVFRYVVARV